MNSMGTGLVGRVFANTAWGLFNGFCVVFLKL